MQINHSDTSQDTHPFISNILSLKVSDIELFRDVCYEWEEELAKYFNIPIESILWQENTMQENPVPYKKNTFKHVIGEIFPALRKVKERIKERIELLRSPILMQNLKAPLSLCFVTFLGEMPICFGKNSLPVFLDIWNDKEIDIAAHATRKLRLFYVTSRDVFNRIKAKSPKSNVHYMPLSIADKYHSENFSAYRNKFIDVFMPGRGNPVLHQYMLRYSGEHRDIRYVYRQENWECKSTDGTISLRADDRAGYMNILASSKVCLLGCSGIDNARKDANGICFVTPRFYESAISGCALIGRYPDNEEFRELNVSRYCPNITSYEQFTHCLENALSQTPEELYAQNRDFILNSLTSKRAEQIQNNLEVLRCRNS